MGKQQAVCESWVPSHFVWITNSFRHIVTMNGQEIRMLLLNMRLALSGQFDVSVQVRTVEMHAGSWKLCLNTKTLRIHELEHPQQDTSAGIVCEEPVCVGV